MEEDVVVDCLGVERPDAEITSAACHAKVTILDSMADGMAGEAIDRKHALVTVDGHSETEYAILRQLIGQ